ncbi:hypothetical protein [Streptomyces chrestomyceticus]|uniref:hypothetical protein n=1 Tax=Streptomyces chrestomyceticus TaxID=68185 RepID=UPI0033E93EBF
MLGVAVVPVHHHAVIGPLPTRPAVGNAYYFDTDGEQHPVPHDRRTPCATATPRGWSSRVARSTRSSTSSVTSTTQRYAHLQPNAHKAVLAAWQRPEAPLTIAAFTFLRLGHPILGRAEASPRHDR